MSDSPASVTLGCIKYKIYFRKQYDIKATGFTISEGV